MKTFTQDELKAILDKHAKWIRGEAGGERANLYGANLSWANLSRADISLDHYLWNQKQRQAVFFWIFRPYSLSSNYGQSFRLVVG